MDFESLDNTTFTNTSVNSSGTCCDNAQGLDRSAYIRGMSFIFAAVQFIALTSGFLNSMVLWSLAKIRHDTLRAKVFIVNLCIANFALPVLSALDPAMIFDLFGQIELIASVCLRATSISLISILILVQPVCAIFLACDRIYAVAKPLHYNAVGNNTYMKNVLLAFPWLMALVVWICFLVANTGSASEGVCTLMEDAYYLMERLTFIDAFLTVGNVTSFVVYITLFAIVRYRQLSIKKISNTSSKSTSVSLMITYFLTNITTLFLYLPAPLYSIWAGGALTESSPEETVVTELGLITLHLCNTFLDPLILIKRIRVIRNSLPIKKKPKSIKAKSKQNDGTKTLNYLSNSSKESTSAGIASTITHQSEANMSVLG